MPHVITHDANTNDIMHVSCDTCVPVSQPPLDICDMLEIIYWHAVCVSQMTSTKINCLTFSNPR